MSFSYSKVCLGIKVCLGGRNRTAGNLLENSATDRQTIEVLNNERPNQPLTRFPLLAA
jgi:hypothetical protein